MNLIEDILNAERHKTTIILKTNYDITVGYKAVIVATVKAESEEEAKELALKQIQQFRDGANKGRLSLSDDTFEIAGVLNLDKSWNTL